MISSLLLKFKNHHLAGLYQNFKDAQNVLKHIFITHKKTANTLPWYLILGPTGSGKTTLLARADLEYIQSPRLIHKSSPHASGLSYVNWWVTRKAVFLDVPGYYLNTDEPNASLFPTLLKLVRKKNKLSGVIYTIDFSELLSINKTKQAALFQKLKESATHLTRTLQKPFLIYIAITKVDRILGFKDFFTDLGAEERSQPWGISFPVKLGGSLDLADTFNQEFEILLKRINERLIWRLHHERDIHKRRVIHRFPLQIESLKATLSHLIYQLNEHLRYSQQTQLRGIYFLSGEQQGESVDCLYSSFIPHFEVLPTPVTLKTVNDQGYFIRDFLKEVIFPQGASSPHSKLLPSYHPRNYRIVTACAISALFITAGWGLINYQQKKQSLNDVHLVMEQYQQAARDLSQSNDSLKDILPALDNLRVSLHSLQQASTSLLLHPQKEQQQTLINKAKEIYQHALQTKFWPAIAKAIEQQLQNNSALDTGEAYSTLKAYLMLGDAQHLQLEFLNQWFSRHQPSLLPQHPELEKSLETLLTEALAVRTTPLPLNGQLINETRRALIMMPEPLLAYLILKNNQTSHPDLNSSLHTLLGPFAAALNTRPLLTSVFNPFYFNDVYNTQIPAAVQEVSNGNWIIGQKASFKKREAKYLLQEVRDLFIAEYANQWKYALAHLQLPELKTLEETELTLRYLSGPSSLWVKLPSLLTTNLTSVHRNDKLGELTSVFPNKAQQQTLLSSLRELHTDVNKILQSESKDLAAFQVAKFYAENESMSIFEQLQNKANDMPASVKPMLMQLSHQTWNVILQQAHRHVNTQWQAHLIPFYRDQIENRYPLKPSAEKEISLSHFNDFFGPKGLLDNFFTTYLKPFVNTDGALWHWKKIQGHTLGEDQQILIELERANLIRTMFFGKGSQLLVAFSLQPLAIQTNLRHFELELNGQGVGDFENANHPHHIEWPGSQGKFHVNMTFEDTFGQSAHKTLAGPWAWFKLLHRSTLQQLNDTQHFELTIDVNNHAAKYQLVADSPINPFVSGIIEQFRSPDEV